MGWQNRLLETPWAISKFKITVSALILVMHIFLCHFTVTEHMYIGQKCRFEFFKNEKSTKLQTNNNISPKIILSSFCKIIFLSQIKNILNVRLVFFAVIIIVFTKTAKKFRLRRKRLQNRTCKMQII
jgi:hypothetical protein